MRIIGGRFRGKTLLNPPTGDFLIRPTSDRARESLFNILLSGKLSLPPLEQTWWLDGFAGTGSVGLEAFSRGAIEVFFMEKNEKPFELLQRNCGLFPEGSSLKPLKGDILHPPPLPQRMGGYLQNSTFQQIVFLDPPYGQNLLPHALQSLRARSYITPQTFIIYEQDKKDPPFEEEGSSTQWPFQRLYEKTDSRRRFCFLKVQMN